MLLLGPGFFRVTSLVFKVRRIVQYAAVSLCPSHHIRASSKRSRSQKRRTMKNISQHETIVQYQGILIDIINLHGGGLYSV
jgi:hypothetical protein